MAWIISWQLMGRDSFSSTLAAASKALSFLASVPAACTALPSTSGSRRLRAAAALLAAPLLAAPLLAAPLLAAPLLAAPLLAAPLLAAPLLAAPLLAAPLLAAASLAAVFAFVVDIGFSQLRCRAAP